MDAKATRLCDFGLPFFDISVVKLLNVAALHAYQMIVMAALVELEHRLVRFKVVPYQQACLLELQQHTIDCRQARVGTVFLQQLVDVFR